MGRQANLLVSMLYAAKYLLLLLTDEPAPCATGEANERTCLLPKTRYRRRRYFI